MLYPSYAELYSYCSGFMAADLPWLNSFFAELFSDPRDSSPEPYRFFYTSLSMASTYLLALIFLFSVFLVIGILAYLVSSWRDSLKNVALFLYNYFLGGLAFAAVVCAQGAFMNMAEEFTVNYIFYLLGLVLVMVLIG